MPVKSYTLIYKYKISPSPAEQKDLGDLFETGRLAITDAGPWHIQQLRKAKDFEWDLAPLPKGPKGRVARVTAQGYTIWSGTKHLEESWELVKFLTGEEVLKRLAALGRRVVARKPIASSEIYVRPDTPWHEEVFLDAMSYGRPQIIKSNWVEMDQIIRMESEWLVLGKKSPEEVARAVAKRVNRFIEENPPL